MKNAQNNQNIELSETELENNQINELEEEFEEEFEFCFDEKVTSWYRTQFTITAKNKEEAKLKAIEYCKNGNTESESWEIIDDTIERIGIQENDNQATQTLFFDDEEFTEIWDNTEN